MAGIYIHIPFCRGKCLYCDFYSVGTLLLGNDWAEKYALAARRELDCRIKELMGESIRTIYIGGGTPSLLPADSLRYIVNVIDTNAVEEFTIEVNPDDVNEERARQWAALKVNRVSMGVQSFVDGELQAVGRRHTAVQAENAFHLLRRHFSNVSIDLIFGLPGQTSESWAYTLDKAVSLRPQHISAYTLMYEPGTVLTRLIEAHKINPVGDETIIEMYGMLAETMRANGYNHYEISNFALPSHESRHNLSYWKGDAYLGIGPGAHSFNGKNIRRANPSKLKEYVSFFDGNQKECFYKEEKLGTTELREEMILTRLRMSTGLPLKEYGDKFGEEALSVLLRCADNEIKENRLEIKSEALILTGEGLMVSDRVILALADF